MALSSGCAKKKVGRVFLLFVLASVNLLEVIRNPKIACIQLSERRNAALDVVKERMNLALEVGGGSNDAMLTNLTKLFTALSDIKEDNIKPEEKQEKLPFLDLAVKLQFCVDVEIWIDCFKGIEDSTAKFKANAFNEHA